MLIYKMAPHVQLFAFLTLTSVIATASITTRCPAECSCELDDKGRKKVSCIEGAMVDPIPVTEMDATTEIIEISSPQNNMNILTIGPIFQGFRNLEELHITRSNVPNIGMDSFYGLKRLETLNLTHNNISLVLDTTFRGLENLVQLHLDHNRISRLSSGTFRFLSGLKILTLTHNRINELVPRLFLKMDKLQVLRLNSNHLIEMNPDVFEDIKTLRVLECTTCSLRKIDQKMFTFLPDLEVLNLQDNKLKHISSDKFDSLPNLRELHLCGNHIPEILAKSFSNQHALQLLDLQGNAIVKISDEAFHNLTNLTSLSIGYNRLERFDGKALKPIAETLERLVISGNKLPLRDIRATVQVVGQLKDLGLQDMDFMEVPLALIPDHVRSLSLAGNYLSYISPQAFPHYLAKLDLSRNRFRGLDERALIRLEQIPELNLDRNPWNCDLCHIIPMLSRANMTAFAGLWCAAPHTVANRRLGTIRLEELELCSTQVPDSYLLGEDNRLGVIAAGASILVLVLTGVALLAALCYSRRHTANYYTHEDKRGGEREAIFDSSGVFGDNPEISFKFPLDGEKKISICTIDEIKKDHALINGGA